jgi:hypothetical protein
VTAESPARPFVPVDAWELRQEPVASFTAQQLAVHFTIRSLANYKALPWVHHGQICGLVERGELTHSVRSIADAAKVSKDVAQGVIEAEKAAGLLEWIEPTTRPTTKPTTEPTKAPTRARKLRIVNYLRNSDAELTDTTSGTTSQSTIGPVSQATESRSTDRPDSQKDSFLPSLSAPARPARRRIKSGGGEPDPRHRLLQQRLEATFFELRGQAYGFNGRDAKALTELLRLSGGDIDEVERRWRIGLAETGFRECNTIHELAQLKWNAYTAPPPSPRPRGGPRPLPERRYWHEQLTAEQRAEFLRERHELVPQLDDMPLASTWLESEGRESPQAVALIERWREQVRPAAPAERAFP